MKPVRMRPLYYLAVFLSLVASTTFRVTPETADARAYLQSTATGTIPETPTPAGTIPTCPPELQRPDPGTIIAFLSPVAIYSGCVPQGHAARMSGETSLTPTLLYHNPADGFPTALGYLGEAFAVFAYSPEELERLITVLEAFECETLGKPLEACNQVNGIQISQEGATFVTAAEMRIAIAMDSPTSEAQRTIYLPLAVSP